MADIGLRHHDAHAAKAIVDELVDVYAEVYGVPPYAGDPFFSIDAYADRLYAALDMGGFETVTARIDGRLVGYVHGVTLSADMPWWLSLGEARPGAARAAAEAGKIFWLRELMVRLAATSQGIGRQLHDAVIARRSEPWTTLTCVIDNEPAHSAYLRWGYEIMGRIKHAPESPTYDAMLLAPESSP
ncbi:GNAT family N-acetyltransferase [Candidatus Protofrankia californiensis]|uniref:GNAT family N-acetyltransferase n=1 Tax=Candidatus Protofrankia californiensis TaxID=1839754 RepID=UPI0010417E3C|nr:GNAT family N-acetyltransferase [Candidatus Protofrankia californiensis]